MSGIAQRIWYIWRHPANRRRRIPAVIKAVCWQLDKRLRGRPWEVSLPGGMRVRCYPDSQSATLSLYCHGLYDYDEMRFLLDYLRPGDHFLDVGANVGIYSLLAASAVGPSGWVDAFEPVPSTRARLFENLELNRVRNVWVHPLAVGAECGQVTLETGRDAMNGLVRSAETDAGDEGIVRVDCVTLDKQLTGRQYTVGKIDIEGAEPLAFLGAQRMLAAANPPVWLLEINGLCQRFGYSQAQLARLLGQHGFELAHYDADRRELLFGDRLWTRHDNLLAISDRIRPQLAARLAGRQ